MKGPSSKEEISHRLSTKILTTAEELEQAKAIRRAVFIDEQSVPLEIEMDDYDESATHVLAFLNGEPAGTARWRYTKSGTKLERFAVPKSLRGRGIGKSLVMFVLEQVKGADQIYLHAQSNVISFYEKYGFSCVGDQFYEADIPHRKMVYLSQKATERR
ncbi:MAG: GNAT family N-acetyltransferase [Candidatus Neomarinimicrobiota bacterium]